MNVKATKRKHLTYDDQFRASAVLMLKSQGYPETEGALTAVANHLKVARSTLYGWFHGTSNPPPANIQNEKKEDLKSLFTDEIYSIMGVLPNKRDEATYQQLVTSMGIFFDKIRLIEGLPTEIIGVLPDLVQAMERHGLKASEVFQTMLNRLNAEAPRDSQD